MEIITSIFENFQESVGMGFFILLFLMAFVGIVAQWVLYEKANLPGIACLVPVWNVIAFLKIVGRPAKHMLYLLIPIYNVYFIIKVYIELCNSFGQTSKLDYVLVILLNGLYILNLGLSYKIRYKGPVYKGKDAVAPPIPKSARRKRFKKKKTSPQLA